MNLCCFLKLKRFFCQSNQEFNLMLKNLVDIFEVLNNNLNWILHGKNTNCINAFMVKLGLGIVKFKKETQLFFTKLDIAIKKKLIELKAKLEVKVEAYWQLLKQEFKCYFPGINETRIFFAKICGRNF